MDQPRSFLTWRNYGLVLATVAWGVFFALSGSPEAILYMAPVFLVAIPLAFDWYVGEQAIVALRGSRPRVAATIPDLRVAEEFRTQPGRVRSGIVPVRGPPAF